MEKTILYRKLCHSTGESFSISHNTPFTMPLHSHEEYELIYIISGTGKEYIGDTVTDYYPGELTLIGSNVPHLHLCNSCTEKNKPKSSCHLLQFPISVFPSHISDIQEMHSINTLLQESMCGIRFHSKETIKKTVRILNRFNHAQGTERIIMLYKILDLLSKCNDRKTVSPIRCNIDIQQCNDPVERIYRYLQTNFKESIELEKVSSYIGQTSTSVCRLFKQKTGKTVFTVLNEIRIGHACRLLSATNLTNAQIAYECGFNNISYFNKVFKSITLMTPKEYKHNLMINPENLQ